MDAELNITTRTSSNPQAAQKAGREDAEAYQKGSGSVAYGGGAGLASGVLTSPNMPAGQFSERARRRRELEDEIRGRRQAEAERAWEKAQATRGSFMREQNRAAWSSAEEERARRTAEHKSAFQSLVPPKLVPPKLAPAAGGGGGGIGGMAGLSALSVSGIPYVSTVARAVIHPMGAAAAAAGISLLALAKAAHSTMQEFENARRLYARQLQSGGMPGGFVAMRGSLARVMGVGESEVYQYGRAVQYLSARLASATTIQTRVNRELTSTSWEFQILGENVRSVFAIMANEAAPALRLMAAGLNEVTKNVAGFLQGNAGKVASHFATAAATVGMPFASAIGSYLAKIGAYTGAAPAPPVEAWSKRLPTSQWERMGMVMGAGVGGNPAQQTARNTKHAADLLQKILHGMTRSGDRREMSLMPSA